MGRYEVTVASSRLDAEGLLERDTELASVDRALDRMGAGLGSVVLVEGPAGIGKSALLAAAGARAQARGFAVLRARGSEFEQEIAFGLARQLFEPMLRMASAAERRRLLAGVAEVGARALGVQAGDAPVDQFAAIHGLFWLCANWIERSPLVVAVDDVQWGDDPSLAWLGYLARRASDLSLALLLAWPPDRLGNWRFPGSDRPDRLHRRRHERNVKLSRSHPPH
jgi:predicted ATPase